MIYKKDSSEFMVAFDNATSKLKSTQDNIDTIKTALEKKLNIITNISDFLTDTVSGIKIKSEHGTNNDKILLAVDDAVGGLYDKYGMTVHQHMTKTPKDIFNLLSGTGPVFKDIMTVKINDVINDDLKFILMDDRIKTKDFLIHEFSSDTVRLSIELNTSGLIGDRSFNMIELCPFMPGSFDIQKIDIFETGKPNAPSHTIENITKVPKCRLTFNGKISLERAEITFKLLFKNSNDKYVLGLKHMYFLNASLSNASHIIMKITEPKAIEYIYNTVHVHDQFGQIDKYNLETLGILFYINYSNEILSKQIDISTLSNPKYITSNISSIYMYVPLDTSVIAITPDIKLAN